MNFMKRQALTCGSLASSTFFISNSCLCLCGGSFSKTSSVDPRKLVLNYFFTNFKDVWQTDELIQKLLISLKNFSDWKTCWKTLLFQNIIILIERSIRTSDESPQRERTIAVLFNRKFRLFFEIIKVVIKFCFTVDC